MPGAGGRAGRSRSRPRDALAGPRRAPRTARSQHASAAAIAAETSAMIPPRSSGKRAGDDRAVGRVDRARSPRAAAATATPPAAARRRPPARRSTAPIGTRRRRARKNASSAASSAGSSSEPTTSRARPVGQDVAQRDDARSARRRTRGRRAGRRHRRAPTARTAARPNRCSRSSSTGSSAAGPRSPDSEISTAGRPSAPIGPCADTVTGSARRTHWPTRAAGRPRRCASRAAPRPAPCARAPSGGGCDDAGQDTTHGLRIRVPAMSPSTITPSTGRRPPRAPTRARPRSRSPRRWSRRARASCRRSRVLNTRPSSSSAAVPDSPARPGRVAVGEHDDPAVREAGARRDHGLQTAVARRLRRR